jgi:hypothetical protein
MEWFRRSCELDDDVMEMMASLQMMTSPRDASGAVTSLDDDVTMGT